MAIRKNHLLILRQVNSHAPPSFSSIVNIPRRGRTVSVNQQCSTASARAAFSHRFRLLRKTVGEWGNYPNERNRLFRLFDRTRASNIILLSGSVQFAELSRLTTPGGIDLTELTSGGLTHTNAFYASLPNSHRIKSSSTELNFGLVELMHYGTETVVNLSIEGINGETLLEHSLVFD